MGCSVDFNSDCSFIFYAEETADERPQDSTIEMGLQKALQMTFPMPEDCLFFKVFASTRENLRFFQYN